MYLRGPMFSCPQGRPLPPPRWRVTIALIKGSALAGIPNIESWYDIPYAEKLKYLRVTVDKYPELTEEAARTTAHLKRFHEHPRYELFYEIKPLLNWLKGLIL